MKKKRGGKGSRHFGILAVVEATLTYLHEILISKSKKNNKKNYKQGKKKEEEILEHIFLSLEPHGRSS